jgi:hypothetical protein
MRFGCEGRVMVYLIVAERIHDECSVHLMNYTKTNASTKISKI